MSDPPVDFGRDVAPILRQRCVVCHGVGLTQAGLDVTSRIALLRGGASGPAILESNPSDSLLLRRISGSEDGPQMPPTGALPKEEIAVLRSWVSQGAPWDSGVSFAEPHVVSLEARRLFEAVRVGDAGAIGRLLDADPDLVRAVNENGSQPLAVAAYVAGVEEMKLLLERGADPNASNDAGIGALIPATHSLEKTHLLVEAGAEVNARTAGGDTALIVAARRTGSARVLTYLLDRGAEAGTVNKRGFTALHRAARSGDLEALQLLLQSGAEINAKARGGRVPLFEAARQGNLEAVRLLLSRGADPNAGDLLSTLIPVARHGSAEILEALLEAGTDFGKGPGLDQVLVAACYSYQADPRIVESLLDRGADPEARGKDGRTALDLARGRGYEAVETLLREAIARRRESNGGVP